ncbi:O-antigen ligase family protein [Chitinispirillales bacterium ANBcel5]|uniref:O-antigen ligase family protein n=1 Tax=Cellulosispirillum alkaliphilum TaxID=3039283 RepID=UPI002A4E8579|nr:O-antigen ligase family protein [Chitinispirillales bacterium ANBcel5]
MKSRDDKVSIAMWIPLLWMLRCGSRSLTYWLDPDMAMQIEQDFLTGNPIDRQFFLALEFLGISILVWRRFKFFSFVKSNYLIIILYMFMGISLLWSQFPDVVLRRWVRTLGDLIMVMVVLSETNVTASIYWLFRRFAFLLVPISVLFVKYYRHMGVTYDFTGQYEMWVGVTTHKNSLGQVVTLAALFFIWSFIRKKWSVLDIPILISAFWLLSGSNTSKSTTSIIVFLIGITLMFTLNRLKSIKMIGITAISVVLLLFVFQVVLEVFYDNSIYEFVVTTADRDETLTGRTELWAEVINLGMEHALFGAGLGTFWMGDLTNNLWEIFPWEPGQAHNGYIDLFVELGLIGLILVALIVIAGIKSSLWEISKGSELGKFRLIWIVLILIYNISESTLAKPTALLWFVFLLFTVHDPEPRRPLEVELPLFNDKKEDELEIGSDEELRVS